MNKRAIILPPVALVVLWFTAIWWPARSAVSNEEDRLAAIQTDQLALITEFDGLNAASDQLDSLNAEVAGLDVAIPSRAGVAAFVRQLDAESLATDFRIEVLAPTLVLGGTTLDPDRAVPAGMSSISFSLTGQGSFEAAMEFVDQVATLPRLVVIDELGLTSIEGESGQVILDLDVRVFTTEQMTSTATNAILGSGEASELDDLDATVDLTPQQDELLDRVREDDDR